ncbi:hypothetical protein chiPu_0032160, partial [Chiloscyllium punctatum]|nr:hypothetical protein [Chiloscyllium punctatum]
MLGLDRRALAVDFGVRIGEVDRNELDVAADREQRLALAALFQALQNLVFDLDVPGEIIFAGLDHRARRGDGIAASLHLDRVEEWTVGHVVVGVELATDQIARFELDEFVGAGTDGFQIVGRLAGLAALVVREQMLRNDAAIAPDKGIGPERCRLLEVDADREVVDLLDGQAAVGFNRYRRGRGVA